MFRLMTVIGLLAGLQVVDGRAQSEVDLERIEGIQPRHYIAYRTTGELSIDGKLDEPSWQRAAWTEYFVDIEGDLLSKPRLKTRAKMLWDDAYFYVAADLEEPHVWATLTERDATIYHDNDFEVFIDPDGDTHQYYEFEINAYGTEWDLFLIKPYRDGGPHMNAWQIPGLQSGVQVWGSINDPGDVDQGWVVELAFPWSVLKECASRLPTPPQEGDQWRVNFSRVEWGTEINGSGYTKVEGQSEDNWVWSPQGLINMHYPEKWGFVQFSTETVGRGITEFVPAAEEEARRVLRGIYYRQRQYREEHGRYSADLDSLGMGHQLLHNFLWPPVIQVTDHMFEAGLEEVVDLDEDGRISRWVIRQDSRIWKD